MGFLTMGFLTMEFLTMGFLTLGLLTLSLLQQHDHQGSDILARASSGDETWLPQNQNRASRE